MKRTLMLSSIFVMTATVFGGSLEPAAGPGPTMKTLVEVEPRIAVQSLSGDLSNVYIISNPGSYYLTGDINAGGGLSSKNGIKVEADDVTIDLMGFKIKSTVSGTNYGVFMDSRRNVEVRNGTIREFYIGVYEGNVAGREHRLINVRAISNSISGICLNSFSNLVKDCTASDNGNLSSMDCYGIYAQIGSTVTGNLVRNNGASATGSNVYGVFVGQGSKATDNSIYNNGKLAAGDVFGIWANAGSVVAGNAIYDNGCEASDKVYGIRAHSGCTISGNTVLENGREATGSTVYGIYTLQGCTVTGNTALGNGFGATPSNVCGIGLVGYCLVDQNTAYNNGTAAGSARNLSAGSGSILGVNLAP